MTSPNAFPRRGRLVLLSLAALLVLAVGLPWIIAPLLGGRLHAAARDRGFDARWRRLAFAWPMRIELSGLEVTRAGADAPLVTADRVEASLGPRGLSFTPRVARLVLSHARVSLPAGTSDDDTTAAREDEPGAAGAAGPRGGCPSCDSSISISCAAIRSSPGSTRSRSCAGPAASSSPPQG